VETRVVFDRFDFEAKLLRMKSQHHPEMTVPDKQISIRYYKFLRLAIEIKVHIFHGPK
jgi:hypothetical protein